MPVAKREVLALYVRVEMSKEIDQDKLQAFVAGLSESELAYLVRVLSRYRENAVKRILLLEPRWWELVSASSEEIAVTGINESVNHVLEAYGWNLDEIVIGGKLCGHPEFASAVGAITEERTIGIQDAGRIQIIDGMHRIIRMACDGRTTFPVYVGRLEVT